LSQTAPGRAEKSSAIEVPAQLGYYETTSTPATARIVSYGDGQRVARAVFGGLACWGLAVLSVFVPLGHFFLVPAFLIAGPVIFFMRLMEGVTLRGAHGTCPKCGVEQEFTESGRLLPRHPVRCSACSRQLELVVAVPTSASPPQSPPGEPPAHSPSTNG
jgi:hypothetical protein